MDIEQNLEYCLLFEVYKSLLTLKQQEILSCFLDRNVSISEIAQALGSSRQAVNDVLKRTLKTLTEYENKLKILEKFKKIQHEVGVIEKTVKKYPDIKELEKIAKDLDTINSI